MIARIVTLSFLLVAIVAVIFFVPKRSDAPQQTAVDVNRDFYLKDFELSGYKVSGEQTHTLYGALMEREASSKILTVTEPRIDLRDNDKGVWQLNADTAEFSEQMEQAKLLGDVVLIRENSPSAKMMTSELTVALDSKIVTTDTGVTIAHGKHKIKSEMMTADLSQDSLKLTDRVRGIYVP